MTEPQDTTPEEFRKIASFPDYSVSNLGRVRRDTINPHGRSGHIMTSRGRRYLRVSLFRLGKQSTPMVHRLVAAAFIQNPLLLPQVNHKSGVKLDNRSENLEWCTAKENVQHAAEIGLMPTGDRNGSRLYPERLPRGDDSWPRLHPEKYPKGEGHGKSKLTSRDVLEIRRLHSSGMSYKKIAAAYSMSKSGIFCVVKRLCWDHVSQEQPA